jgi:hypothetical protein
LEAHRHQPAARAVGDAFANVDRPASLKEKPPSAPSQVRSTPAPVAGEKARRAGAARERAGAAVVQVLPDDTNAPLRGKFTTFGKPHSQVWRESLAGNEAIASRGAGSVTSLNHPRSTSQPAGTRTLSPLAGADARTAIG